MSWSSMQRIMRVTFILYRYYLHVVCKFHLNHSHRVVDFYMNLESTYDSLQNDDIFSISRKQA